MFAAAPTASSAVALALDSDEAAFRWIVETHISGMTQVCFVVCGDRELADWPRIHSAEDRQSFIGRGPRIGMPAERRPGSTLA